MALSSGGNLLLMATLASAGAQIGGGIAANSAAKQKANLEKEQARIALEEANREADRKSVERRRFLAEQRMAYLANGVTLEGTPGVVQHDTYKEFQQEIDAIRKSGVAQFKVGMLESASTSSYGRSQLVSGFMRGVTTAAKGGYGVYKYGRVPSGLSAQSKLVGGGFNTKDYISNGIGG